MKSSEFQEIKDLVESLAIKARQSGTPSQVLLEMQTQMQSINRKMDKHIETHAVNDKRWDEALNRIEPYIKKAENDREFIAGLETRGKKLGMWAGLWLTFAAVIGSIYYGFKHLK